MSTCTSYLTYTCYIRRSCCTFCYAWTTYTICWSCIIVLPCYTITFCVSISCSVCSCVRSYTYCCCSISTCVTLYCPYVYTVTYFLKTLNCSVRYTQISCCYSTYIFCICSCYCICLILLTCSTSVTTQCYSYFLRIVCICYCSLYCTSFIIRKCYCTCRTSFCVTWWRYLYSITIPCRTSCCTCYTSCLTYLTTSTCSICCSHTTYQITIYCLRSTYYCTVC